MSTGREQFGGQSYWVAADIRTRALSKRFYSEQRRRLYDQYSILKVQNSFLSGKLEDKVLFTPPPNITRDAKQKAAGMIGNTNPVSVTSPVIPVSLLAGSPV